MDIWDERTDNGAENTAVRSSGLSNFYWRNIFCTGKKIKQIALHVDNGSKKGIMFLICVSHGDNNLDRAREYQGWQREYKILGVYERHVLEDILK